MNVRGRPIVTFAICLGLSGALCLAGISLLYKDMDPGVAAAELPLLAMLCVGVSLAITLFGAFKSAMLTFFLIVEYAALGYFSSHAAGDWEVRVFDSLVLQVSIAPTYMFYPAAIFIAAGAFILCRITVAVLARRGEKEPEIIQALSYTDMYPRLPSSPGPDVTLSREEIDSLLGRTEQMAAKK
jgi:hypothetical protein